MSQYRNRFFPAVSAKIRLWFERAADRRTVLGVEQTALQIRCQVRAGGESGLSLLCAGQRGADGGNDAADPAIFSTGLGMG